MTLAHESLWYDLLLIPIIALELFVLTGIAFWAIDKSSSRRKRKEKQVQAEQDTAKLKDFNAVLDPLKPDCPLFLVTTPTAPVGEGVPDRVVLRCSAKQGHDGDCYDAEHNVFFTQHGLTRWGDR